MIPELARELGGPNRVAGLKQTRRALNQGKVRKLFLAADADPRVLEIVTRLAGELKVRAQVVPTMAELGACCGIETGCSAAALLKTADNT